MAECFGARLQAFALGIRSAAVRALIMRGMAWEEAKHASTSAQQPQQLAA
jgi:hypothetical protein